MRRFFITAMILLSFLTLSYQAFAGATPTDIQQIKTRGYIIVGMTRFDSIPFYYTKGGEVQGIDADIARRIADYLGVAVRFNRDANSFQEVVDKVVRDEIDIAISKLSITGPRMQVVRFTIPYIGLRQAMIVNRLWLSQNTSGQDPVEAIRNFSGSIAFMRNSSYDTFARLNFPTASYSPQDNWNEIINGVISGRFSAGFRDEFEIKRIAWEHPEAGINTKTVTITDLVDNIAAAVDYKNTALLSIANHVITTEFHKIDVHKLLSQTREIQKGGSK
jgi:polar amino acid transport system substrate-binding protein